MVSKTDAIPASKATSLATACIDKVGISTRISVSLPPGTRNGGLRADGLEHIGRIGHVGVHIGNEPDLFEGQLQDFFLFALCAGMLDGVKILDVRQAR